MIVYVIYDTTVRYAIGMSFDRQNALDYMEKMNKDYWNHIFVVEEEELNDKVTSLL